MKYRTVYEFGLAFLCCGIGVIGGLSREQAWGFVVAGGAVALVAIVASAAHLWRHGKPRVVGAKEAERMSATGPQVVTTTIRDEVRR